MFDENHVRVYGARPLWNECACVCVCVEKYSETLQTHAMHKGRITSTTVTTSTAHIYDDKHAVAEHCFAPALDGTKL